MNREEASFILANIDRRVCDDELNEALDMAIKALEQEPKTGHWEQYGNSWEDKFKCSECGKEQPKILCGERIIGHWSDYCPNCGCRMVEPQESEEE